MTPHAQSCFRMFPTVSGVERVTFEAMFPCFPLSLGAETENNDTPGAEKFSRGAP